MASGEPNHTLDPRSRRCRGKEMVQERGESRVPVMGPPLPQRDPVFCSVSENTRVLKQLWVIMEPRSCPTDEPFDGIHHSTTLYSTNAPNSIFFPPLLSSH